MNPPSKKGSPRRAGPGQLPAAKRVFSETIPSQIDMLEPLVTRAMQVMLEHKCVNGQAAAAELSLREALANAILHGNKAHPQKRVQLDCFHENDGSMLVVVKDEGQGFDPDVVRDPTLPENILRPCGRGIYLIRRFMDEVEYRNGGRELRMRKKK